MGIHSDFHFCATTHPVSLMVIMCCIALGDCQQEGLAVGFYSQTCPNLEQIVETNMRILSLTDPTTPSALLRLLFHDCQVQGCDASILLDSQAPGITSELVSDRNFGVKRLEAIDRIKANLEMVCPGIVSCADIIVLAARDAVRLSGGPFIQATPLGRRDATNASNAMADMSLPVPETRVEEVVSMFSNMGMSIEESVSMLGAHTLGVGHCVSIANRLYPNTDPSITPLFAAMLSFSCPNPSTFLGRTMFSNSSFIGNDVTTLRFDNQYFRDVLRGRGLFSIDSAISSHPLTASSVVKFSEDEMAFFQAFSSGFVKLASHSVLTGTSGQIRSNCHFVVP